MQLTNSILLDVKGGLGLDVEPNTSFDSEILIHVNSALSKLNQNGVGVNTLVTDSTTTWEDFLDPTQETGNKMSSMVPQFVMLSCKMLFDPPPPSAVDYFSRAIDEILWRLKVAYE